MGLYVEQSGSGPDCYPAEPAGSKGRHARVALIDIIEGEIIPRLFLAHRHRKPHAAAQVQNSNAELEDPEFMALLFVGGDSADIVQRLQTLLCAGASREQVYIDLLAPVPGTLSRLWAEGRCSFDEIACGLCCIDDVLRTLHEREQTPAKAG